MGKKEQSKLEKEEKDDTMPEVDQTKGGKKSKKSKRKDFDEDDIAKELEEMSLEANGGELPKPTQANSNENEEPKEDSKTEAEKSSKGKKGKNKRRGKDDDDEEIDDLLAELEAEYKGEPLPEKSGEKDSKSDDNAKKSEKSNKKSADTDSSKAPKEPAETKAKAKKEKAKPAEESKKSKKASEAKANDKKSKATEEEEEDESKSRKGKPNKKMLEAMKAAIAKQKEVEEKYRQEQKERDREEQERVRQLKEKLRLEKEKKEKQKLKQKERLKKLKEGGKILTNKQKLEQKRAQAMLEHLRAQGLVVPGENDKLVPGVQKRPKKKVQEQEEKVEETPEEVQEQTEEGEEETAAEEEEIEVVEEGDDVVDDWDQLSGAESGDDESEGSGSEGREIENGEHKSNDSKHENEVDEEEEDEEDEKVSHIHQTEAEKRRERAQQRMEQRKIDNENTRSTDRLRAPVVCVLGHVDHGKTKILDKLRRTNVQEGEVGGITQQIGATNVPLESIRSQTRMVKDFDLDEASLPGLLIIDTPGHESFSNLRSRGSSLCDIAILVVDITQGLEPQTLESINLLKKKKTPFVVALNKVDRVFEWESYPSKDIRETIRIQNEACQNNFQKRNLEIIQALNIQGLNAALFWENPDPRSFISLVPTSAISGDGMGNLMSMIVNLCQKRLAKRLMFSEELQCTVLEVKTIQGHGVTIDVILINGQLKEGDTIILAGTEGPIVTQIRSLLTPKPMKEIRVKGQYDELKVVQAALGVKLAAKELEKAIAGLNLQVAHHEDEIEILKEEVDREFKAAMRSIKVKDKGVYVQASTLGALEALLEFFKTNSVPYSGIRVGPVVKRDVMRAAAMLEHNPMYAVILAFDVKVERDAQELADKEGIKIFSEETIYHLGDRYVEYIKDFKKKKQDEFRHVAVFPCKLKILPDSIFNKRDPIVLGVTVDSGILRTGTILCVPSKEFVEIGVVSSLEFDHKVVEIAKKGVTVCIKIEPLAGHTPKLFGRHFDAEDLLVSRISRESIDACKEHFRDDLGKNEWKLMAELKKQFCIL